ncbi:biotin/lipoyl-containing protein [Aquabacter cavernae]|uniref:biotin/lipoyl-containing protein n=1 Tax=Aquabacter cavernae TaxID=2496029 RepID=UPI000F8C5CA7|nr:biotin/lipoyl-containing protein [Aquabacter cavernae]
MDVRAEIGAVVAKIAVGVGDTVGAGEALMVLEAMKMEFPVEAPVAATVSAILVNEGDMVEEDQILVSLEPTP